MKSIAHIIFSAALALFAASSWAEIKLDHNVQVEKLEKDKNGKEVVKLYPAGQVVPGDVMLYTITATNNGAAAADNIVITDAISEHMLYIADSAQSSALGKNTTITFSADGGKTFLPAGQLTVTDSNGTRPATTSDYTHIRWQLNFSLAPQKSAKVLFKARVK